MPPIQLAVVGKNISYSKSPLIQSAFAKAENIDISYTIQDVGEGSFSEKIKALRQAGFLGCNITVPFKEEAFKLADHKSARAIQAGAANTFLFKEGRIFADNTDGVGLIRDLTQNLGFSLQDKRILICGAGGAVRGILGPLIDHAPHFIILANRSIEKAETLARLFPSPSIKASTYAALSKQQFDLMIDGTSLKTEALPIPDSVSLSKNALVYDLKYSPDVETSSMIWGHSKAAAVHDGMGMLIEQAAEAFKIWTGRSPDTHVLRAQFK